MAEEFHVVGPLRSSRKWVFLCPECDDDRVTGLDGARRRCTTDWLEGQLLSGDAGYGERSCYAWQTDPYEGVSEVSNKERRYFYYHTVALLLGGSGRRVDLPACVKEKIEELFGKSEVGFCGGSN